MEIASENSLLPVVRIAVPISGYNLRKKNIASDFIIFLVDCAYKSVTFIQKHV